MVRYRVLIDQDDDGVFVATCPTLPGRVSQGPTRDEAVAKIKDAISEHLESLRERNEPIPASIREETVAVGK